MPSGYILLIGALASTIYLAGKPIVHVVKKDIAHPICKVVTLGKKCGSVKGK